MPGLEEILPLWEDNSNKILSCFQNNPPPDEPPRSRRFVFVLFLFCCCFLKELNKFLYNFLWNGKNDKNDKMRRSDVCQAYEVGGLKMVDIKLFLGCTENQLA